jgi:hypothetical protein
MKISVRLIAVWKARRRYHWYSVIILIVHTSVSAMQIFLINANIELF